MTESELETMAAPPVRAPAPDDLLRLDHLTMRFGGVTALDDVSFAVRQGEIAGLIGPNGAGKTTVFNVVTGVYTPTDGIVSFDGQNLAGRKKFQVTRLGIARTFQNIRLFSDMTALENVMVAAATHHRTTLPEALFRTPRARREERDAYDRSMELLTFMGIAAHANSVARNLPYGDQRRLEIARAMATQPKLLLLDEPAAGFNPAEKRALAGLIRAIRDRGYTVLLIEHDMSLVMSVCENLNVLDFGKRIAEGPPEAIRSNPKVIEAYLGAPAEGS